LKFALILVATLVSASGLSLFTASAADTDVKFIITTDNTMTILTASVSIDEVELELQQPKTVDFIASPGEATTTVDLPRLGQRSVSYPTPLGESPPIQIPDTPFYLHVKSELIAET